MHEHIELIMPPFAADDLEKHVASVMAPFDENNDDEETKNVHAFWDFYVIGGTWSGDKYVQSLNQESLAAFYDWCNSQKVTCLGLVCGKQELAPSTQIPAVDAKWNELFPPSDGVPVACPLFSHSNDQYDSHSRCDGDVWTLGQSLDTKCQRVMFAYKGWVYDQTTKEGEYSGPLSAYYQLAKSLWNGLTWQDTQWDGTIRGAMEMWREHHENYKDEFRELREPKDDWLCVTVDIHH